jgi:hypothetical protein
VLIHATCIRTLNTHTHTYVYIYTQRRCLPQDQPRGPPRQALGAARVLRRHTHTDQPAVDTHTQTCARPVLLLVIIQHHATTSLYYTTLHQRVCCTSLSSSSSSSSFQYKVPSMHTPLTITTICNISLAWSSGRIMGVVLHLSVARQYKRVYKLGPESARAAASLSFLCWYSWSQWLALRAQLGSSTRRISPPSSSKLLFTT